MYIQPLNKIFSSAIQEHSVEPIRVFRFIESFSAQEVIFKTKIDVLNRIYDLIL